METRFIECGVCLTKTDCSYVRCCNDKGGESIAYLCDLCKNTEDIFNAFVNPDGYSEDFRILLRTIASVGNKVMKSVVMCKQLKLF